MLRPTAACHFWTSELQKVARECGVFHILTYKYASRHSRVAFLNIGTSKMAPPMWCFVHFDLPSRHSRVAFLNIGTSKMAPPMWCFVHFDLPSRHSGVAFLNIGTSKMAPPMWCFVHFDLQMCFAPQRRAILQHRNFKKCYDTVSFLPFSLANVLFATAACHFSPVR